MEDLDALLAELEESSRPGSKDHMLQMPSSCKQDPATAGPPAPCGREPLASVALKVQLPPCAQPPGEALKTVYSSPIPVPQPLIPSPPPTAAARQLDELLADLGHMQSKVSLGPGGKEVGGLALTQPSSGPRHPPSWQLAAVGQEAGVPVEPKPSLDNMLGSLTRDLQELGITATPASVCATCHKPIAGKVLTALGKTWHPEHFTCARCGQELGSRPFFERGGQAYCEEDYHQAFSPRCAYCAGPIREKVLTALDQTWHPEHFFCAHCGKVFGDDGFHEQSGKPYCHRDFLAMFAPKCQGCDRPVMDNYLSALQGVWHPECFVCTECLSSFASGSFFELQGRPYCELHFHQRQGNICHGCGRPVTGRCITAAGRKYHPEHFICAYCLGQLQKGTFREHGDKMYCRACHDKLFL
ncbi:leupaxin isoform X1 [Aquila chrysaetos chrysaetos]|uniref:leupaxin isoform X1 n=1 Tax=Aquila chrysaetos chrysaetos TaxID=223781 RepID=UPI001176829F|nr:leupaxin isoform X1 [Aquila chrysaetos chrysaetos]